MKLQISVSNDKWKRVIMICSCKTGSRWTAMWHISHCSLQHTLYQRLFWQQHIWHINNIWNISQDVKTKVLTTVKNCPSQVLMEIFPSVIVSKTVAWDLGGKNEEQLVLYIFPVLYLSLTNWINYLSYMKYIPFVFL